MKSLIFAMCILAAVMVGDAQLIHIIKNLTSKVFDIKELFDINIKLAEYTMKLGLLKIVKPELIFCLAEKKDLIDEEGGLLWDEALVQIKKLVRYENKMDEFKKIFYKCKEEADKSEGSKYEKTLKVMECMLPIAIYIGQQRIIL